jgi:hypothetical protein
LKLFPNNLKEIKNKKKKKIKWSLSGMTILTLKNSLFSINFLLSI